MSSAATSAAALRGLVSMALVTLAACAGRSAVGAVRMDGGGNGTDGGANSGAAAPGAHALLTHDQGKGVSPATTTPVTTQAHGSALLALSMGRTPNFEVPRDSYANTWSAIGGRNDYANGPYYTAMWSAVGAKGGRDHTLTVTKRADPVDELSLAFIEVKNASAVKDAVYAYPKTGSPNTPGSVTVDGPATLIAIWGGDSFELPNHATPSDGFTVIDSYLRLGPTSGVQVAIATKQVTEAGTYSVTWTATPTQGAACYLIAIE